MENCNHRFVEGACIDCSEGIGTYMKSNAGRSGINIFEDRKASKLFIDISEALDEKQRKVFTKEVREMYDKKLVSEDGEYGRFKITVEELLGIANKFGTFRPE